MADIQYLNYGDLQIDLLAFLTKAANEVQGYVQKLPWSKKRKEKFMSAYSDLMNRGIQGASNGTGQWMIDVGGDALPFDSMDKKDKEMYQEAAYFIQQQMSGIPTKASLEEDKKKKEEEEKKDLPLFDNKYFTEGLHSYIGNQMFGGRDWSTSEDWNPLDERGDKGLRGHLNRALKLAEMLEGYSNSLDESKLNFEGSPFKNLNDFKSRLNNAITALRTKTPDDDKDALNLIGLKSSDYFNNGGDDTLTSGDFTGTYNLYYNEYLPLLQKAKQDDTKLKRQAAYNNTLFFTRGSAKLLGRNPQELKAKYGADDKLRQALFQYSQQDIRRLTPDEQSEIHGAYRYLAKDPIDGELLKKLQSSSSGLYKNAAPNRFKKINGIDNLIWDSSAGQVIQIQTRDLYEANKNQPLDLFAGVKTLLDIQNDYMNSTEGGFTSAELREVAALLFDLGAAVDPEGVTSAGLSLIAAGIRDYNRGSDPEGWTWGDTGWAALDHGLGLLSAIPVVGGLVKGSWAAAKLGSYIPKMEKWIRLAGRAGSTYAMAVNAPGALNTLNKIKNGEDLSLKDYLDLAYFFIGGLGHHQLNRGNRVERSAMKARGIETSNSVLNKTGITRTKAKTTNSSETTPTLKVLKTGEDGKIETKEIPITKEQESALKKAKPDKLNEVATEAKINNIPEGYKIVEPTINSNWRSRVNTAKSWFGKGNSEIFGTPTTTTKNSSALKSDEEFELYLSEHNNTWLKKIFNGSNRDIRRYDKYLGNNNQVSKSSEETPKITEIPKATETSEKSIAELRKSIKGYLEGTVKHSGNHLSEEPFKAGDFNFEVNKFPNSSAGNIDISFNGNVMKNISFENLKDMMKKVADFLKENRRLKDASGTFIKRINAKEMGEILRLLKAKGVFKQGGTIDRQRIQKYKEFIKK